MSCYNSFVFTIRLLTSESSRKNCEMDMMEMITFEYEESLTDN